MFSFQGGTLERGSFMLKLAMSAGMSQYMVMMPKDIEGFPSSKQVDGGAEGEVPVILHKFSSGNLHLELHVSFEGSDYCRIVLLEDSFDYVERLSEYAEKTPRCACCGKIIFPGQPVIGGHIQPDDSGMSHYSKRCNNDFSGYIGRFNVEGELLLPDAYDPLPYSL